ncbi:MAG: DUF2092 domain-containing protein, partial [Terracidiphilus sp.]
MKRHLIHLTRLIYLTYAAVAALAVPMVAGRLQAQSTAAANDASASAEAKQDIDPDAMAALTRMGQYLRSLKAFQIEATSSRDDVLEDGQLITLDSTVNLLVRTPDRLRVEVESPRQHRLYLYNGKEFTVFAERVNYYATAPAPDTVGKLAADLADKFGIELPLTDLFYWGGPQSKEKEMTGAADVGPSQIGGVSCEHFAFRQAGLDWQVWIQLGDYPLPRKLVITTMTDEARPRYST